MIKNMAVVLIKSAEKKGIDWFTTENTFFIKYPNGFESIPEVDTLAIRGFIVQDDIRDARYYKKIGSYTLTACLSYENGKPVGIEYYQIYNSRRLFNFRYESGALFTNKYSFGWRQVKTLNGVPGSVMEVVKKICWRA